MNPKAKVDFVAKAEAAWGKKLPDWVRELALEANRTSQVSAAKRIGYSGGALSGVFGHSYKGSYPTIEGKVRGALMGLTVMCPVVGEIGRDRCLDEQRMGNTGASSIRAKLYRACRNGCPHSRIKSEGDDAE